MKPFARCIAIIGAAIGTTMVVAASGCARHAADTAPGTSFAISYPAAQAAPATVAIRGWNVLPVKAEVQAK